MIATLDFTKYLKTKGFTNIYPNNLPKDITTFAIGVYSYSSEINKYYTVGNAKYQFLVVANDLNECEVKAIETLNNLINTIEHVQIGDCIIEKLHLLNLMPMYIGTDESGRFKFSFNVQLDITKI